METEIEDGGGNNRAIQAEEGRGSGDGSNNEGGERSLRKNSWNSFHDWYKTTNYGGRKEFPIAQTLILAFQSLGVVYGDLGTSPLYVFSSISISNPEEMDILGIMSLIFWTLTPIGLIKYVSIVLRADDNGEGSRCSLLLFSLFHCIS